MPWVVVECGRRSATGGVRRLFWSIVLGLALRAEMAGDISGRQGRIARDTSPLPELVDHRLVWLGFDFLEGNQCFSTPIPSFSSSCRSLSLAISRLVPSI